jgi:hypothetical protein
MKRPMKPTRLARRLCQSVTLLVIVIGSANDGMAADLFVNPQAGNDGNSGSRSEPVATIQQAIGMSRPGDTISLLPKNSVYRQHFVLSGRSDLTIEGNGVTLEGADPLPESGWEEMPNKLFRRKLPRTTWDRHLLIIDGRTERMRRTQSSNSPDFPKPRQLSTGQFCFESIDDSAGWLYVRGKISSLEWAVRPNGLGTGGKNSNIIVRNLNARHFLNDGFNIHGHAVGMKFENIRGYDCFDEGFSAHDTCECTIDTGVFYGNENAIADVNDCVTHYRNCEFRDSVSVDVLLIGRKHSLTDCRIFNTTPAAALTAGPRGEPGRSFGLQLERVAVKGRTDQAARVRINGGSIEFVDCQFENAVVNTQGATLITSQSESGKIEK